MAVKLGQTDVSMQMLRMNEALRSIFGAIAFSVLYAMLNYKHSGKLTYLKFETPP